MCKILGCFFFGGPSATFFRQKMYQFSLEVGLEERFLQIALRWGGGEKPKGHTCVFS